MTQLGPAVILPGLVAGAEGQVHSADGPSDRAGGKVLNAVGQGQKARLKARPDSAR